MNETYFRNYNKDTSPVNIGVPHKDYFKFYFRLEKDPPNREKYEL
jgi:hypothetical protein